METECFTEGHLTSSIVERNKEHQACQLENMNPGIHSAILFAKKSRALALGVLFLSSVKWGKYSLTFAGFGKNGELENR